MQARDELPPGKRIGKLTNLRPIMKLHGLETNPELAEVTGIPLAFVKDLTALRKGASYETASQIARNLGVSVEDLTGRPLGAVYVDDDEEEISAPTQTLVIDENLPEIKVTEVHRDDAPAFSTLPPEEQTRIYRSIARTEKTLNEIKDEVAAIRTEQIRIGAIVDKINEVIQKPPKRGLFGRG